MNGLAVIGTRPEAIKMLPVVVAMCRSEVLNPIVISTGQHSKMVREVLALGGVAADVDLGVMSTGSLNDFVSDVLRAFGTWCTAQFGEQGHVNARDAADVFERGYPAGVLVHGDGSRACLVPSPHPRRPRRGGPPLRLDPVADLLLRDDVERDRMLAVANPYRDGRASERVVEAMIHIRPIIRAPLPRPTRLDVGWALLQPVLAGVVGFAFFVAVVGLIIDGIPLVPSTLVITALFFLLGFGGVILGAVARTGFGVRAWVKGFLVGITYVPYTWLTWPVLVRATYRHLRSHHSWAKTEREALDNTA